MDDRPPPALHAALARLDVLPPGAVSRDAMRFMDELVQSPLQVVEQQPAQQHATVSMLQHQRADVCMRNTPMFVQAQDAFHGLPACLRLCHSALHALETTCAIEVRDAAASFACEAEAALAQRASLLQLEETYDASLHNLLDLPVLIRGCVARGDDADALALTRHLLAALPTRDALGAALVDEVHRALHAMHARLLATLQEVHRKLPDVRRTVDVLHQLARLAHDHLPSSALRMAPHAICATLLRARYTAVEGALRSSDVLQAVDAWKDTVLHACTSAWSLFVDPAHERGGDRAKRAAEVDRDAALLTAAFAVQSVDVLHSFLQATLAQRVAHPGYEATGQLLHTLHSRLASVTASCATVGLAMGPVDAVLERAALALWTNALDGAVREAQADAVPDAAARRGVTHALNALRHYAPYAIIDAALAVLGARLNDLRLYVEDWHALATAAAQHVVVGIYEQPFTAAVPRLLEQAPQLRPYL